MRKTMRLEAFDYSSNGAYFICTYRPRALLTGQNLEIAIREFETLSERFAGLSLDSRKFRPDHLHAILSINGSESTVSAIVQAFKSLSTREIKRVTQCPRVWQRGFYDRIVRDETELAALRECVEHNDIVHAVRQGRSNQRGGASSALTIRRRG